MVSSDSTQEAKWYFSHTNAAAQYHMTPVHQLLNWTFSPFSLAMSLFQYGFRSVSSSSSVEQQSSNIPPHLPEFPECELGRVKYESVMATNIAVLSNPSLPSASKKPQASRGKYTFYMPKNHAEIGKYAIENGNERARHYFLGQFPKLTESTVRNFKKAYKEELACQRKK